MNGTASRFFRLSGSLAGLVVLGWVLTGQAAKPVQHGIPLPTDWSHRHMIFPGTTSPERLARVSKDPRYWQQVYRQGASQKLAVEIPAELGGPGRHHGVPKQRDWSINVAGSGTGAGAENYPLKYSYDSLVANCASAATPDYVVYSTGLASSGSQASIVAFDNLYSGCPTTIVPVPNTYWAYDTTGSGPTPGTVMTSPIASLDGAQVAFVQTDGSGHGAVVLLKWKPNDGSLGTPSAPANDTAAQYASCATPPCMVQFDLRDPLNVQTDDQASSIYYDFTDDIAWVGDNGGYLHQFHPFFLGTPAEVRAPLNPLWPAVASALTLSSPVYDSGTGNVFVGDASGFLHAVNATTAAVTSSGQLDFGTGIIDGPLVDSVNGYVYVFASSDGAPCVFSAPCAAVYQLPITFTSGATGKKVKIGKSTASPNPAYLGGFDSSYYNSGTATGNLYACGSTGLAPQLFQVPISPGMANITTGHPVATLGTATDACSPVTDVPNPNTAGGPSERVFVSVQNNGFYSACGGGGCVMSFLNTPWLPSTNYTIGQQVFSGRDTETVIVGGMSSTTQPIWPNIAGGTQTDGGVTWLDQGPLSVQVAPWASGQSYALNDRILDTNDNVQIVTTAGTSGSSAPAWNMTAGGTTPDGGTGGVTWTNAGPNGTFAIPAAGGSSGIISDNVVGSGTLAGASQIYFTTLSTQTCTTSATTGVCAVQASQPALQ